MEPHAPLEECRTCRGTGYARAAPEPPPPRSWATMLDPTALRGVVADLDRRLQQLERRTGLPSSRPT